MRDECFKSGLMAWEFRVWPGGTFYISGRSSGAGRLRASNRNLKHTGGNARISVLEGQTNSHSQKMITVSFLIVVLICGYPRINDT